MNQNLSDKVNLSCGVTMVYLFIAGLLYWIALG